MPNTLSDTSTTAEPHQSDSGTTAEGADQPAIPARAQRPDPASDTPGSEGEPVFDVTMPNPTPGRRLGDGGPDTIQVLTPEGERVDTAPPEYLEIVDSLTAASYTHLDVYKRQPQVRSNASAHATIASEADGRVVLASREIVHPAYPDAVCRAPGLVALDASAEAVYTKEWFGPVAFLIKTASTDASLERLVSTVREHGAMTAAVYSSDETVLAQAREAATAAGVALSENLTSQVFVNQTAAFSDYHGTGANPAANASYTDAAFVANRFRVITSRRHI